MTEECCDTCRFIYRAIDDKLQCRRRAPQPYNAMTFRLGEILRDIAWNYRVVHEIPTDEKNPVDQEITDDITEGPDYAIWPEVERDEWCGEWSDRGDEPMRAWKLLEESE